MVIFAETPNCESWPCIVHRFAEWLLQQPLPIALVIIGVLLIAVGFGAWPGIPEHPVWKVLGLISLIAGVIIFFNPSTNVTILKPIENQEFISNQQDEINVEVKVTSQERGKHLWLIVDSGAEPIPWYPANNLNQCKHIPGETTFSCKWWIKGETGSQTIHIFSADYNADRAFQNHVDRNKKANNWTPIELPNGVSSVAKVKIKLTKKP